MTNENQAKRQQISIGKKSPHRFYNPECYGQTKDNLEYTVEYLTHIVYFPLNMSFIPCYTNAQ